jgi:cystathionine beta-lyase
MSFDNQIDRSGTNSSRWRGRGDVLALTIGDSDFPMPDPIRRAIERRTGEGVIGYDTIPDSLGELIANRLLDRHGWEINPDWLVYLPNVVQGLNFCCRGLTEPGHSVMTEYPIYSPFLDAPSNSGRSMQTIQALIQGDRWSFNFDAFESAASLEQNKLFLLCNPQNPLGRMLTRDEIEEIGRICVKNDVLICSDEIHCDISYPDQQHIPMASLSQEIADITVTLMAPTKAFSISGLGGAFAIISNDELRHRFESIARGLIPNLNSYSLVAMQAAYGECDEWFEEQMSYLLSNRDYLYSTLKAIPGLDLTLPEATYFLWLDMRGTGLNNPYEMLLEAGLELTPGEKFGLEGFLRLNFASPKTVLEEAVNRIEAKLSR